MAYLTMRDGRKLYYEESGAGQPVVFLHGWKASANVYTPSGSLLAGNYRCIRYDHCGHLRSDAPAEGPDLGMLAEDLREVLVQLRLEKPVLVGWSMGGMTILEYLRRYGCQGLEKIVLVDIGPVHMEDPVRLAEKLTLARADFREFMRQYYEMRIPGFLSLTREQQKSEVDRKLQGHHPAVLTALWQAMCSRDHRDVLPAITCPTAIFHAGIMPVCDGETARYYQTHIAGPTKVVCFEQNSHALLVEDPQRFAAELQAFIG